MASESSVNDVYCLESLVRGHHIYKRMWTPVVGESLPLSLEEEIDNDPRAAAVLKCGIVVGHVPRETARTVWYFLKRGGCGTCEIGWRKKGKGLEVPCVYTFSGPWKVLKKLQSILQSIHTSVYSCPY